MEERSRTMRGVSRFLMVFASLVALAVRGALRAHGKMVMGTVAAVDAGSIEVKTTDGKTVRFKLTEKTKYMKGDAAATSGDVKPSMRVSVHLADDGSAGEVHLAPDSGSMKH
jgi:phosphatidylserine decarboxylase